MRRARWFKVIGIAVLAAVLAGGCALLVFVAFVTLISDPAPPAPPHPVVFGVRADGASLVVSTGRACPAGTEFNVIFRSDDWQQAAYLDVTASEETATIDVGHPGDTLTVTRPLPAGFDWQGADTISVNAAPPASLTFGTGTVSLAGLSDESARHPGAYLFGEAGWLTPAEVAARDGVDLLTICTPMD